MYWKNNGAIEIFKKNMYGKEVSLDRVQRLVRLTGQVTYVSTTKATRTPLLMFALWAVTPHHVAPNLVLLFLKRFNGTNAVLENIFWLRYQIFRHNHIILFWKALGREPGLPLSSWNFTSLCWKVTDVCLFYK